MTKQKALELAAGLVLEAEEHAADTGEPGFVAGDLEIALWVLLENTKDKDIDRILEEIHVRQGS